MNGFVHDQSLKAGMGINNNQSKIIIEGKVGSSDKKLKFNETFCTWNVQSENS